jgi:integrase
VAKPNLRLVAPATENRTVKPERPPNAALRTREHLTVDEVEKLIEAAKANRYGYRDALMMLLAYRHGLRAAEVVDLRWEQIDFKTASLHIPPSERARDARTAPASAGEPGFPICFRLGTLRTAIGARLLPHDRAGSRHGRSGHQGARPHAAPCLRLQARQ